MTLEPLLTQEDVDRKQRFLTREGGAARPLRWNDAGYWVCQDGDSDCVFSAYPDGSNYYGHRQYDLISRIPPEPAMESQEGAQPGPFSTLDYYDGTGCMEAVERMGIAKDFYRGQVVKYIWRLGRKDGNGLEDALKARDYLNRLITLLGTG